jgi:phytol kinase
MFAFSSTNLPLSAILLVALFALLWSYVCLAFAAYLKTNLRLRTGYTRKVFHVLIFVSAVLVQAFGGFAAVCAFGAMVSIVVGHALLAGPGSRLYEAIAREQDGKRRTYFIVIPYFATLIGGLASNVLFGPLAVVGYLVGGLGDAAGEPVGTRWGTHRYALPLSGYSVGMKTFEGSMGVVIASIVALLIAVAIRPEFHLDLRSAIAVPAIAVICGLVEAVSPRGWDNVPMQIVPTLLAGILLAR